MINDKKAITLAETHEILVQIDGDKAKFVSDFIKKFVKMKSADALKLKQKIESLNIVKLKDEDVVKIVDFLPQDAEDIKKIFTGSDVNLNQDEITQLLELFKNKN